MITIELPFPHPDLNPNRSNGKRVLTSGLRKKARSDAFYLTRQILKKYAFPASVLLGDIPISITFIQPDKHRRDRDNLLAAFKPSLDGVADALGINDCHFEPVAISREFGKKPGCVLVVIGDFPK